MEEKKYIRGPRIPLGFPDLPKLSEKQLKQLIESRITHFRSQSNSFDDDEEEEEEEEESLRDSDDEMVGGSDSDEELGAEEQAEVIQFATLVNEITPEEAARQLQERDMLQKELEQER